MGLAGRGRAHWQRLSHGYAGTSVDWEDSSFFDREYQEDALALLRELSQFVEVTSAQYRLPLG